MEERAQSESSSVHASWLHGFLLGFSLVALILAMFAAFRPNWEAAATRNVYSRRYYGKDYSALSWEEKDSIQRYTPRPHPGDALAAES
ncbi:MAG: hypothetical protein ACOC58_03255 [Chloroflexota bacterium]